MSWKEKLKRELISLGLVMFYFALWFAFLITMKMLLLREYNVEVYGLSMAFVGALIVAKVILIMDHIPIGTWIEKQPAFVDVLFRTLLYSIGIIIILVLEKAFEARNEAGGFFEAIPYVFKQTNVNHIYVNSIAVIFSLLGFNFITLIARNLGKGGMRKILLSPPTFEKE